MRHLLTEILAAKDFAQSAGKADREQTRWWSGVDSSRRSREKNFRRKTAAAFQLPVTDNAVRAAPVYALAGQTLNLSNPLPLHP